MLRQSKQDRFWSSTIEFCITGDVFPNPWGRPILALRLCASPSEPTTWQRRVPSVTSLRELTTNSGQLCGRRETVDPGHRNVQGRQAAFWGVGLQLSARRWTGASAGRRNRAAKPACQRVADRPSGDDIPQLCAGRCHWTRKNFGRRDRVDRRRGISARSVTNHGHTMPTDVAPQYGWQRHLPASWPAGRNPERTQSRFNAKEVKNANIPVLIFAAHFTSLCGSYIAAAFAA